VTLFVINPGADVLEGGVLDDAWTAVHALREASAPKATIERKPDADYRGRFAFDLVLGRRRVEVLVPGVPMAVLTDDSAVFQPRLYVDGSSWYWQFAIGIAKSALVGDG
jgi:hypothetical protein